MLSMSVCDIRKDLMGRIKSLEMKLKFQSKVLVRLA